MLGFLRLFSSKPSPDAFSRLLIKEAKKSGVSDDFTYHKETFTLQLGTTRMFLGNVFAEHCHAKTDEQRKRIITNFLEPLKQREAKITRDEALERIVAVVRERALFSFMSLYWQLENLAEESPRAVSEPLSDWYCRSIVLDFPGFVRMVNEDDLKEWDLSFEELFSEGLSRLDDSSVPQFTQENGYSVSAWKDDYDNSRILLPSLFEDLPIEGEPVFVIPNRVTLMIADSKNVEAVKAMLARAEEIVSSQPRPHNPAPLCYRDGELQDFTVSPNSPLFNSVERARKLAALGYYSEQTDRLNELYEKTGKDLFVGKYQLIRRDDGSHFSWAVWTKGILTLLPKVDVVMFYDPDKPEDERLTAEGDWDQVCAVAGDLMLDTEMFPPRYYVSRFPAEEHLKEIADEKRELPV